MQLDGLGKLKISVTPYGLKPQTVQLVTYCLNNLHYCEHPHLSHEMNTQTILNGPTSRNPVDINQVGPEARQLVHL